MQPPSADPRDLGLCALTFAPSAAHDEVDVRVTSSTNESLGPIQNVAVPVSDSRGHEVTSITAVVRLCQAVGGEELGEGGREGGRER